MVHPALHPQAHPLHPMLDIPHYGTLPFSPNRTTKASMADFPLTEFFFDSKPTESKSILAMRYISQQTQYVVCVRCGIAISHAFCTGTHSTQIQVWSHTRTYLGLNDPVMASQNPPCASSASGTGDSNRTIDTVTFACGSEVLDCTWRGATDSDFLASASATGTRAAALALAIPPDAPNDLVHRSLAVKHEHYQASMIMLECTS